MPALSALNLRTAFAKKVWRMAGDPSRWTKARALNAVAAAYNHFVRMPDAVPSKPLRLIVDPSSHCHLACPLCPTGQGRRERARGTMSFEHFRRLFDEVAETLFEVDLFGWGEPLQNKELEQMIAHASARQVRTVVSTHLNLLDDTRARALCDAGLDEVIVSLDGASAETYGRYRVGGDFDAVITNVQRLVRARGRRTRPHLTWKLLVTRHNEHEVPIAKRRARTLGFDSLDLRPLRTDMGRELSWSDAERVDAVREWLPKASQHQRYDRDRGVRLSAPKRCLFLWTQAVVDANGRVSPCCAVYDPAHDIGTVRHGATLLETWNSEAARALRRQVRERDTSGDSACANCVRHGFIEY